MKPIEATVSFRVELGAPIALDEIEDQRPMLSVHGVYFMCRGYPRRFNPLHKTVIYIGKAIRETIFSRARKHRQGIREHLISPELRQMRPGKRYQALREALAGSSESVVLVPGYMPQAEPYLISCAEEYLLHEYLRRIGELPEGNTK